jgi:hypothetical protein
VARIYAGILGPLAMLTAVIHGSIHGGGVESTLGMAWLGLWAFAGLGFVMGSLGEWVVGESVQARIADEIAVEQATETKGA